MTTIHRDSSIGRTCTQHLAKLALNEIRRARHELLNDTDLRLVSQRIATVLLELEDREE